MAVSVRTAVAQARASEIPSSRALPSSAVVLALGRIEARRMIRHPVFGLTILFSLLLFRGAIGATSGQGLAGILALLTGGLAIGLLISSVLTTNVAALRPRRDGMNELYGSLPAPVEARTGGVLVGLVVGPFLLSVVVSLVAWAAFAQVPDFADDADLFLVVQAPLSVLALGGIGVAVARWVPFVLGGALVIVAHVFTGIIWIVPWIVPASNGVGVGWHLTYLIALIALAATLAFARDRRTVPRFALGAAMLTVAIVSAIEQTPPGGY